MILEFCKNIRMKFIALMVLYASFCIQVNAQWESNVLDPALKTCIHKALEKGHLNPDALTALKCHSKKIENLDGLNQFTNLTSLSLFNNKIIRADLSAFTKLETLNLAKNKLTFLYVKNLSALESLYAFQNKLTEVDLTGLTALKKLRLAQNKITELNTQDLSALESAHLFDNQMEDLDIRPMVKLTFMDVKQNPMPDELYDFFDEQEGVVISHDGNADDWK